MRAEAQEHSEGDPHGSGLDLYRGRLVALRTLTSGTTRLGVAEVCRRVGALDHSSYSPRSFRAARTFSQRSLGMARTCFQGWPAGLILVWPDPSSAALTEV